VVKVTWEIIRRFKILHIVFWFAKTIFLYHTMQENHPDQGQRNYFYAINATFFQICTVYFCTYVLIPRYFVRERYFRFITFLVFLMIICTLGQSVINKAYLKLLINISPTLAFSFPALTAHFFDILSVTAVFVFLSLTQFYYFRDKKNKQIEKEKLQTELEFLKAQINPHFLFNALNSIYVLMDEDKKMASDTLLKFSSLLRYQLYECNSSDSALDDEFEFLSNYILLEKVRNGENMNVSFEHPEKSVYLQIAPFILIPFVENAFKHISHFSDKDNLVHIKADVVDRTLNFNVINTFDVTPVPRHEKHNGIGLRNVKRRLELLYEGFHSLVIHNRPPHFSVSLSIQLKTIK
jgi:two-component system LytT family sensor kinase